MSDTPKKFYLTTPIYYVNARPHIGHAYTTIVADVLARRHRLLGDDTFFLTGTDEHGQKIERSAAAAGIPPQQFADQVSKTFEDLWKRMGITNDDYIRTTDPKHAKGVQKLFATLYEKGFIELKAYTGTYCVSDEAFVDVPVGAPCPDCGRITEEVTEENFFFKLSAFQEKLLELIESNTLKIENDARRNEVLSFLRGTPPPEVNDVAVRIADSLPPIPEESLKQKLARIQEAANNHPDLVQLEKIGKIARTRSGEWYAPGALKDLSVSRSSFTWGIPVPEPAASAAKEKHVIYVWLDALANYMTAIGYGSDDPDEQKKFDHYWPADLHLVGKEIIRFHCVYWPAFLLAADLPLPKAITAHGWLLFDNSKMSKSKGNIVRTETILDAFGTLCPPTYTGAGLTGGSSGLQPTESAPSQKGALAPGFSAPTNSERDLFASDVLRYFLLREIPFGQDGSFSFDALITRYNADLANGYGNLVSRTLSMITKYREGVVPTATVSLHESRQPLWPFLETTNGAFELNNFYLALQNIWTFISITDVYVSTNAPWKLAADQTKSEDLDLVLYGAASAIRIITALLYPIMPFATAEVWQQLGLGDIEQAAKNGDLKNLQWGGLKPGTKLGPLSPIFPRADKSLAETMINMENPDSNPASPNLESSPRPETPLKSASTPTPAQPVTTDRLDPAAPPRNFTEATHVAGSAATTTHNGPTPSHTEATPSAPFNTPAAQAPGNAAPADASPQINIDDFIKIDLRVAQIVVAERIPKADKLLRLEVDLGYEKRQILSGIAEFYTPEELIGRRIVVIANLAPRKMRGLESHGMLLAASHGENGKPILATFGEDIALGSRLK